MATKQALREEAPILRAKVKAAQSATIINKLLITKSAFRMCWALKEVSKDCAKVQYVK